VKRIRNPAPAWEEFKANVRKSRMQMCTAGRPER
jgi:hypothetical protein